MNLQQLERILGIAAAIAAIISASIMLNQAVRPPPEAQGITPCSLTRR